ncbi:hypothetical protein [Streptomyces sp. SID3343]|uniref:hypothetical protein n=1 Tax=Streptomyces sp. SID3343 TaxID=2690260 RepID=UPI001369B0CA|nr:hypothetical protein [Streptomyces sp. SID3343]MYW04984.1 hypothetical protein [Streptomyces sp. SID3343]
MTSGTSYDLLLAGPFEPARLGPPLADVFGVRTERVDIVGGDASSATARRDGSADVFCSYTAARGDITAVLDIRARGAAGLAPTSEHDVALALAARLKVVVLFSAGTVRPSAYWAATPAGTSVRARVYDETPVDDLATPGFTIDRLQFPVPELRFVSVGPLPELIRDHEMATPVSSACVAAAGLAVATQRSALRAWESMTVRMGAGWPPFAWYPADFYADDLRARDILEHLADASAADAVREIDGAFTALTCDDAGNALSAALALPGEALRTRGWWWRRQPLELPWPVVASEGS